MVNPVFWVTGQQNITSSLQFQELANKLWPDPVATKGKVHISSYWDHIQKCESVWIVQNPVGNQSRAEKDLGPSSVSSHSHAQQKSSLLAACYHNSPCSRGKSVGGAGGLVQVCILPPHSYKYQTPQSLLSQKQLESSSGFASDDMPCTWSTDIQKFTPLQMNIVLLKMKGR